MGKIHRKLFCIGSTELFNENINENIWKQSCSVKLIFLKIFCKTCSIFTHILWSLKRLYNSDSHYCFVLKTSCHCIGTCITQNGIVLLYILNIKRYPLQNQPFEVLYIERDEVILSKRQLFMIYSVVNWKSSIKLIKWCLFSTSNWRFTLITKALGHFYLKIRS